MQSGKEFPTHRHRIGSNPAALDEGSEGTGPGRMGPKLSHNFTFNDLKKVLQHSLQQIGGSNGLKTPHAFGSPGGPCGSGSGGSVRKGLGKIGRGIQERFTMKQLDSEEPRLRNVYVIAVRIPAEYVGREQQHPAVRYIVHQLESVRATSETYSMEETGKGGICFTLVSAPIHVIVHSVDKWRRTAWLLGHRSSYSPITTLREDESNDKFGPDYLTTSESLCVINKLIDTAGIRTGVMEGMKYTHNGQTINTIDVLAVFPKHDEAFSRRWMRNTIESWFYRESDISELTDHFGPQVGFYFAFLTFYTRWLSILAALGLCAWYGSIYPAVPLGIAVLIWSTAFPLFWDRYTCYLVEKWGIGDAVGVEEDRAEFRHTGTVPHFLIKGKMVKTYPRWRRTVKSLLLLPVFVIWGCGLNVIMVVFFSIRLFSETAYNGPFKWAVVNLATFVHGCVINACDMLYRRFATWSNNWENYQKASQYEYNLGIKLIASTFSNAFVPLMLIAFIYIPFGERAFVFQKALPWLGDWLRWGENAGAADGSIDHEKDKEARLQLLQKYLAMLLIVQEFNSLVSTFLLPFIYRRFRVQDLLFLRVKQNVMEQEGRILALAGKLRNHLEKKQCKLLVSTHRIREFIARASSTEVDDLQSLLEHSLNQVLSTPVYRKLDNGTGSGLSGSDTTLQTFEEAQRIEHLLRQLYREYKMPEYETFKDYANLLRQIGYCTMFLPMYGLGATASWIVNMLAMRHHSMKLMMMCRRPTPRLVNSIGPWRTVLELLVASAFVVLSVLFVVYYNEIAIFHVPLLMTEGVHLINLEVTIKEMIIAAMVGEHLYLLARYLSKQIIDEKPAQVQRAEQYVEYQCRLQALRAMTGEDMGSGEYQRSVGREDYASGVVPSEPTAPDTQHMRSPGPQDELIQKSYKF
eukprot:Clim_evm40s225 gene=Clim_evmTU40s225